MAEHGHPWPQPTPGGGHNLPHPPESMVSVVPWSRHTYFQVRFPLITPASEPERSVLHPSMQQLLYAEGTLVPSPTECLLPPPHDGSVRTSCLGVRNHGEKELIAHPALRWEPQRQVDPRPRPSSPVSKHIIASGQTHSRMRGSPSDCAHVPGAPHVLRRRCPRGLLGGGGKGGAEALRHLRSLC